MTRLDVLKPSQVADGHCPELFTARPLPMGPNSHAVLREG
jgi:hypothetical protein